MTDDSGPLVLHLAIYMPLEETVTSNEEGEALHAKISERFMTDAARDQIFSLVEGLSPAKPFVTTNLMPLADFLRMLGAHAVSGNLDINALGGGA